MSLSFHIEKIKYGNVHPFAPGQEAVDHWLFEVVFDYGEYDLDWKRNRFL